MYTFDNFCCESVRYIEKIFNFDKNTGRSDFSLYNQSRETAATNTVFSLGPTVCLSIFQTTQYSKLEKADILEMTVKHLKLVQRQQMAG